MKKILALTLGIMTALGGFVDLGQIVFTMQGGALFGYSLLWVVLLGTTAIVIYMEMCGRAAAVAKEPVLAVIRTRLGPRLGLFTLIASNLLNLITCAAELGGVGILIHIVTGCNVRIATAAATAGLLILIALLKFQWIERTFGLTGLLMIVFAVGAVSLRPDWGQLSRSLIPNVPVGGKHGLLLYAYFAVGTFSALLTEYEVHFYSSGAIEEDWEPKDLKENVAVAIFGSVLGAGLTSALIALSALVFLPQGIFPDDLGTTLKAITIPFGSSVLWVGALGMLACIGGAAVETTLSGAYNVCQFYNLNWGKNIKAKRVPEFSTLWVGLLIVACLIALTGVKPLNLIDISIMFAMVVMPFTYYPILNFAADPAVLGKHANGWFYNLVGWIFLGIITAAAAAAIPLMILTSNGKP